MPSVTYEKRDGISIITMNRPERMNALDPEGMDILHQSLVDSREDDDVRVIIVTGAGDRAFNVGQDLRANNERIQSGGRLPAQPTLGFGDGGTGWLQQGLLTIWKPIIAAINGWCLGGGCELALACDIRTISETAQIGLPESKRGMGAKAATVWLPRVIPLGLALEMLFTGEPLSAQEAYRIGLVNHVYPPDELMPRTIELAEKIRDNAPVTIRFQKESVYRGLDVPMAYAFSMRVTVDPYTSEDRIEGGRAFLEKRKPVWQNR